MSKEHTCCRVEYQQSKGWDKESWSGHVECPLCVRRCYATVSQRSWTVCSVLPADRDTRSSYKVKKILLTPKWGNFLKAEVGVSISGQR